MKNVCLYIGLLVLLCSKGYSQGSDVIFWVDNSSSINATEFAQMSVSIENIIHEVLICNENNRVAVVHYGATMGSQDSSKIYIESNFTSNETLADGFLDRTPNVGTSDYAYGALSLIGTALDGTYNPANGNIVSPITQLNHLSTNSLVIFLFTDAWRSSGDTYLVNELSSVYNTLPAFAKYKDFKTIRNAKFVVVIVPPDAAASEAAAAIASGGGSYIGALETYPTDPDALATGRRIIVSQPVGTSTGFDLSISQIETVTDFICSVAAPECVDYLNLTSPGFDVSATDQKQVSITLTASNKINSGGVGIYHAEQEVALVLGFHATSGSRFRGYIEECPGPFNGRIGQFEDEGQLIQDKETSFFSLAPNPANSMVTITATEEIRSVIISSQDGKTLYSRAMPDKTTTVDVPLSNYSNGIYTVTVVTANGQIQTQKLVKN